MTIEYTQAEIDFFEAARTGNVEAILSAPEAAISGRLHDYSVLDDAIVLGCKEDLIPVAKALFDRGYDPNLKSGNATLLITAIDKGLLDLAVLLLERGADPNKGRALIAAINRKDEQQRMKFVRLLVEHGCDVNQVFELYHDPDNLFTALDWAKDMPEIAKYLRRKGAKTAAELKGVRKAVRDGMSAETCGLAVLKFMEENFGAAEAESIKAALPPGSPIEVHVIPPGDKRKHYTLFTTGLSAQPMNYSAGQKEFAFAEMYIQLPGDWQLDRLHDPNWNWPVLWLHKLARYPLENDTWLGGPITFIGNEEPPQPLAPNTKMSCLMLMANKSLERADGNKVQLYQVTPIYAQERDFELENGLPALMRAFDRASVPFIVDTKRKSVV